MCILPQPLTLTRLRHASQPLLVPVHSLAQTIISLLPLPNLHVFIFLVSAPASLSQESLPIGQIPLRWVVFLVLTCPVCRFLFGDDVITT